MNTRLSEFLDQQRQEALGCDNKWFCSQHHGYEVTDPEVLLRYYIQHGGASHFRRLHDTNAAATEKNTAARA